MNDTLKTIHERKSCRTYKPEQITDELLKEVLDAGLAAPSGRNLQPTYIVAVQDAATVKKLSEINAGRTEALLSEICFSPRILSGWVLAGFTEQGKPSRPMKEKHCLKNGVLTMRFSVSATVFSATPTENFTPILKRSPTE